MKEKLLKLSCSIVVSICILALFLSTAAAQSNITKPCEAGPIELQAKPTAEETAAGCPDPSACQAPKRSIFGTVVVKPINRILAFGCKTNYRVTNWILADRCDSCPQPCKSP